MDSRVLWHNIETRLDSSCPRWRDRIRKMGQVDAVRARGEGRTCGDDEVFKGLLMAVLSANTDWSKVEALQAELADLFSGFNIEWYAGRSPAEIDARFLPWFRKRKAGSMTLKKGAHQPRRRSPATLAAQQPPRHSGWLLHLAA